MGFSLKPFLQELIFDADCNKSSALTWHGLLIEPWRRSCRCSTTVIKQVIHERRSQTNTQLRNQTKVTPLSYTFALKAVSKENLLTLL